MDLAVVEMDVTRNGYVRSHEERVNSVISQIAASIRTLARSTIQGTSILAEFSFSLHCCPVKADLAACNLL